MKTRDMFLNLCEKNVYYNIFIVLPFISKFALPFEFLYQGSTNFLFIRKYIYTHMYVL